MLTDNKTDDAAMLNQLLADTSDQGVNIGKLGADGAYDHYDCWDTLQEAKIEPIIPPRENAMFQLGKDGLPTEHPRNRALEIIDEGGQEANRKGWKIQSGITEEAKAKMHSSDGKPYWEKKCTPASLKTRKLRLQLRLRY